MERHFSTGTSMIVALMAAHREAQQAAALGRRVHAACSQETVARIEAYLRDTVASSTPDHSHVKIASSSHLHSREAAL
ncbi:hypothetical protein [Rhodopila sp.]|jgi:hypothetical protein|uniref:hypothetical protein n=1 Tax=Rhodopila sp. TaxID=2480087 RepID=UPI002BD4F65C|nr:hypothetical protein [Rhodopila sp.]HVZ08467.1 hypothetical protein [Rhodopila sp.]